MRAPAARELGRLWRTVRWLKPAQVLGRAALLLLPRPRPEPGPAPARRVPAGPWALPAGREPSLLSPTRLRFLGVEHDLDTVGWDAPALPLLWRYNQHYFDDLVARDAGSRSGWQRALVQRWVAQNPAPLGTAWAPYPTSLRIANWIKWFWGGEPGPQAWLDSLALQARWLARRLEWHLLGNHLFVNAKALLMAGLFFDGAEATRWRHTAVRILRRQLPEQFLADGGQFERSPMYHALGLEDLLDLLNALVHAGTPGEAEAALRADLHRRAAAALHWMRCMAHADGSLARFNDCADGIAPPAVELERYAAALGVMAAPPPTEPLLLLPSGYARLARGPALLLADVAPVGPDYLPGHAHADTLCFELALQGRPLLVNRGTSEYGTGARRLLERGTAAHNTVLLAGTDSSEVWSGFRVGRRARPLAVRLQGWQLEAEHDGYRHLPGTPHHERRWTLDDGALLVEDRIARAQRLPGPAVARFHLAPGLTLAEEAGGGHWSVFDAGREIARVRLDGGRAAAEPWQHAYAFGDLRPAQTLRVEFDPQGSCRTRWEWTP